VNIRLLIGLMLSIVAEGTGATPPGLGSVLAWGVIVLGGLVLWATTARQLLLGQARRGTRPQEMARWHARAGTLNGMLWLGGYAVLLFAARWPDWVAAQCPTDSLLADRLLVLLPMLVIFVVATWGSFLSTVVLRRTMAAQGAPQTGQPFRLRTFLVFHVRQQMLILLVPYMFVLGGRDLAVWRFGSQADTAAILSAIMAVYIFSPLMFRFIWPTERLPDGPLRKQLMQVAERSGARIGDIFIWHTGGIMVNACLTGVVRPLRYVFLTDTLVDQFHPAQVQAVFGHELGHARFYHMPFYFLVAVGGGMVMMVTAPLFQWLRWPYEVAAMLVLVPYWAVFFGTLSRRFERQSDLAGARFVACPGRHDDMACTMHSPSDPGEPDLICPYQAWAFTSALARIAALNGVSVTARSWRHGSIASRMQLVSSMISRPGLVRRYDQRLWTFKVLFFSALTVLGIIIFLISRSGAFESF
jgi:STE24 endopeptidase